MRRLDAAVIGCGVGAHVIDPVALELGPVRIYWYSLMWLFGAIAVRYLIAQEVRRRPVAWLPEEQVSNLVFVYGLMGAIVGGRLGYMLFYQFESLMSDPLGLVRVFQEIDGEWVFIGLQGLSFHGGLIGVLVGFALFGRAYHASFLRYTDIASPFMPIYILSVRLGNYLNGELWGRPTDVPWAQVFARDSVGLTRHPSQLYEAFAEGVVLALIMFLVVRWFRRGGQSAPYGLASGTFVLGYGVLRFIVEFFRAPDAHIGYQFLGLTRGQLLCVAMVAVGAATLWWSARQHRLITEAKREA